MPASKARTTCNPVTRAFCSLANCTAWRIARSDRAEPSVGTRMFLNMLDLLLTGIDSEQVIERAPPEEGGEERNKSDQADPLPPVLEDRDDRKQREAGQQAYGLIRSADVASQH